MMSYANRVSPYQDAITALTARNDNSPADTSLALWQAERALSCFYAPFEYVNQDAKLVIVGITPGRTQMNRSLNAFQQALSQGFNTEQALQSVKQLASLSGTMRPLLVEMLNRLAYANKLSIDCCSHLWGNQFHHVHFCSLLKYPVFINGKDYSGQPNMLTIPALRTLLFEHFVRDLRSVNPDAAILPLGETVARVLGELDQAGHIVQPLPRFDGHIVAPPHPSGANAESIALLLMADYPSLEAYQDTMYQQYLAKQSWRKKADGQPQDETQYKQARARRWHAMSRVRQAYAI